MITSGRIAAAHGRFDGIRQVAPVCIPIKYMLSWAHPSPQPKHHLDQFSRFAGLAIVADDALHYSLRCNLITIVAEKYLSNLGTDLMHQLAATAEDSITCCCCSL